MRRVAGAVLAAGSGSRMGRPKGELVVAGERLVDRAVRVLRDGGCDPVFAVVRDGVEVGGAQVVVNPDPDRGMRSSLQLAVDASAGCDALAVVLADVPGIGCAAVAAALYAWRPGRIVIAAYLGRRGHPTVMSPDLWHDALELAGPDEGARALLRSRRELVDEIGVDGDPADLDTPEDVARWTAEHAQPPRPRIGGYRSGSQLDAEGIDAELTRGFGDSDRR